jgi:hypothetical protein
LKKGAPADYGFFRINTLRKIEHCAMIVHIDGDLLAGLRMQHRERGPHRDCVITFTSCAEEGADDALLRVCAAEVVVQDGEESGRVDGDRRGPAESCVNKNTGGIA